MMPSTPQPVTNLQTVRQLIWLYFWLLIFEGALRKWVTPGLSNILLIVRDPVVIAIYIMAMQKGVFPQNPFISAIIVLGAVNLGVSMLVNPQHPIVTFYGVRADFLHIPLIFVIPQVFTLNDVRRVGFWVLLLSIPMALLVYRQFTSPGDAAINAGAGMDSGQIGSAFDRIRPAGTFSFCNGLLAYVSLVAAFLFHGFFQVKAYPKWLLLAALPSLFLMVMLSGSRSVVSAVTIIVLASVVISIARPKQMAGSVRAIVALGCVYLVVGSWAVIRDGAEVLDYRLGAGGGIKTGLVDRYLGTLLPINALLTAPVFGYGIGMGTNAAAGLLTGDRGFLLAEDEWDRVIQENGALLGLLYLFLRVAITFHLGRNAMDQLKGGNTLTLLLFAAVSLLMLNGQFAQPSALGFGALGAGLCLAASTRNEESENPSPPATPAASPRMPTVRSRSLYSETLKPGPS